MDNTKFKLTGSGTLKIELVLNGIKVTTENRSMDTYNQYVFNDIDGAMAVIGKQLKERLANV